MKHVQRAVFRAYVRFFYWSLKRPDAEDDLWYWSIK